MAGLTTNGFEIMRLPEIRAAIEADLKQELGEIDTGADSVFGQIIGVMSKRYTELWELAQEVYNAGTVFARGISQDNNASLVGITRRPATKTEVFAIATGDEGATVPVGTVFAQQITGATVETITEFTISRTTVLKTVLDYVSAELGVEHSVEIIFNGQLYTFSVTAGTVSDIVTLLSDEIYATFSGVGIAAEASTPPETLSIYSTDKKTVFSVNVYTAGSTPAEIVERWTPTGRTLATQAGRIVIPQNTLTEIVTPVTGLDFIDNLVDGLTGSDLETDDELRQRRETDLAVIGAGTVASIRARLLRDIENVSAVSVFENDTMVTDADGRPPKSLHAIVTGGDDQEILDLLWLVKPAGIQTYGNTEGTVLDSENRPHVLRFDRPVLVYGFFRIEITPDIESELPDNAAAVIAQRVASYAAGQAKAGIDFVAQRYFCPIYKVPGIRNAVIEIGTSASPVVQPINWTTTEIELAANEIIDIAGDRVTVVINE